MSETTKAITFFCGKCNARFDVSQEKKGKQFVCNKCHSIITVPQTSTLTPPPKDSTTTNSPPKSSLKEKVRETKRIVREKVRQIKKRSRVSKKPTEKKYTPILFLLPLILVALVLGIYYWPTSQNPQKSPEKTTTVVPKTKQNSQQTNVTQKEETTQKASQEETKTATNEPPLTPGQKQFYAEFEKRKNNVKALFSLAIWSKQNGFNTEKTRCLNRILELDPKHERSLIELGRMKPGESNFDKIFGPKQYKIKQSSYLVLASDNLFPQEFRDISKPALKVINSFIKEYGEELDQAGYAPLTFPYLYIAIFSSHNKYKEYCQSLKQERAAKEGALFLPKERLLISYQNIHIRSGEVQMGGNPGELLNTAILYDAYLSKTKKQYMVIPKMNLIALKYLGHQYFAVLTKHYYVAMQNSESYISKTAIRHFVSLLEQAYDWIFSHYRKEWSLREYDFIMSLFIFRDHQSFLKFDKNTDKSTLGYYRPWTRQMFTYRSPGSTSLDGTVIHEGTHMIMHYFCNFRVPNRGKQLFWFQEGIAEFFEGWKKNRKTGKLVLEQKNTMRIGRLWSEMVSGKYMSLKEMLPLSVASTHQRSVFDDKLKLKLYRQGWGMVHFLMHYKNGKYRAKFSQFVRSYVKGDPSWEAFNKIFKLNTDEDFKKMEAELVEHIKALKRKK